MRIESIYLNGIKFYIINGKTYPSVTSIIHTILEEPEQLKEWKSDRRNQMLLKRYIVEGSLIHYRILNKYSTLPLEPPKIDDVTLLDERTLYSVELAEIMWNEINFTNKIIPIYVEKVLYSDKYQFAGKPDLIAKIDDTTKIIDLKRSSDPAQKQYLLQVGAYALLYGIDKVDSALIISLCPDSDKNPNLEAKIHEVSKNELILLAVEFIDILNKFKKIISYG